MWLIFAVIAVASMIAGNLLALLQDNVKRLLAYSSIAHLGYILVAFLAVGGAPAVAVGFYLVAYFVTTLGAFGVVAELSERRARRRRDRRLPRPRRAGGRGWPRSFAVALFSLAGMPLTAGFIGKFYVVTAGAGSPLWWLLIVLVATSTIGLYYYTRVVVAMYVQKPAEEAAGVRLLPGAASGATSAGTAIAGPSVAGAAIPSSPASCSPPSPPSSSSSASTRRRSSTSSSGRSRRSPSGVRGRATSRSLRRLPAWQAPRRTSRVTAPPKRRPRAPRRPAEAYVENRQKTVAKSTEEEYGANVTIRLVTVAGAR